MNILLRILVILTLILNGVALWFALSLYGKRNLLIDRNDRYRDFAEQIAQTFEADEPEHVNVAADHEARDISAVTLANADINPDRSDFWESYKQELEKIDAPSYKIPNVADLDEVYILTPEGKPELDSRGEPKKAGSPMDLALEKVVEKAIAQRARMNNVRAQLTALRNEYEDTVAELNQVKKQGRESLKTIAQRDETIAGLEADKSRLEGEVADLKGQIETLESEKQSLQADLDKSNEELEAARAEIETLKKTLEEIALRGTGGVNADGVAAVANVTAGVKGSIVRVNNEYNYCLVKLSDEALVELIGENGDKPLPELDYLVRRPDDENGIVGKIRLRTITKDAKTIVCDILADWKQGDLQKGDEVFYLD